MLVSLVYMLRQLSRFFDVRAGEGLLALRSFAILFLVIAAHTILETARDAVFLAELAPRQLNLVYVALAGLTFVLTAGSTRFSLLFGRRNALVCTLLAAAYITTWIHSMPASPRVALGLYLFSGLVGAVLAPQFWLLASQLFTVAQGRRLFGPIASGGVLGGVAGAGSAAIFLTRESISSLLLLSAALFLAAALVVTTVQLDREPSTEIATDAPVPTIKELFRRQPFLLRIAALVGLSTATVLVVDYLFKSSVARVIPREELGEFFARYYSAMNGLSLLVQLFLAGPLVKRFGIVGAASVLPVLLLLGGVSSALVLGSLWLVLATKASDGALRHSLHRVSIELLYLPLSPDARERGKALIDSALGRIVQAATALGLYVLATMNLASPRHLAEIVVVLCLGWLLVAGSLRRPYLDIFRRALSGGGLETSTYGEELDLGSAEILVEALASRDQAIAIAAMNVLDQHKRGKLVPALVLYHDEESVLVKALDLFSATDRTDWIPLGERLLSSRFESVRVAAVRALSKAGVVSALQRAAEDNSSRVQAYAVLSLAERRTEGDLMEDPRILVMVHMPGEIGAEGRLGLLAAITDSPDPRAASVLFAIAERLRGPNDGEAVELLARGIGKLKDPRFVPLLLQRLADRHGRDAVRSALVELGDPAFDALATALRDPATPRRIRLHLPRSISRFGTQKACDVLLDQLTIEKDGLVRYKVLRGLGRIVVASDVHVDRARVEREVETNLLEYLRVLGLQVALLRSSPEETGAAQAESPSGRLILGLLDDKLRQSLERAFRLLKVAHRREDIHRVHLAALSKDRRARANAGEFLDVLLGGREEERLRALLRLVTDDLDPEERLRRATTYLREPAPATPRAAMDRLLGERDDTLAAIAAYHVRMFRRPATEAAHV